MALLIPDSIPVLTDEDVEQIERWGYFLTEPQLAEALKVSLADFKKICQRQPKVLEAYKAARAMSVARVASTLLSRALQGDVKACQFYLKTQGAWLETTRKEITGKDGAPVRHEHAAILILPQNGREIDSKVTYLPDGLPPGTPLIEMPAPPEDEGEEGEEN